ncbi:hypothetical protein NQ176_g6761 [Zarea fungicola]|uniref:Uncharacterized protein n=1 Tax=Zarea fungicola TaxID=93591 RepID=A0ACC1N2D8_9HYPO|nr:hypothetical protein NQ176_g6761 [Lecanicillium fungicola]
MSSRPNQPHHLFDKNINKALPSPPIDKGNYTTGHRTGGNLPKSGASTTVTSDVVGIVTSGTNKFHVAQHPSKHIIITVANGHVTLHAPHSRILDLYNPVDAGVNIPQCDELDNHSIFVDLKPHVSGPPHTPLLTATTVPVEQHANSIPKQLREKLNKSNLSVSKAVGGDVLDFQYFIRFETGYILAGQVNSAPQFWIVLGHVPSFGRATTLAGSKSNGKQRAATRVVKTSSTTGKSDRASNKGRGIKRRGNEDNNGSSGKNNPDEKEGSSERNDITTKLYACPFYKFDPLTHYRCGRKYDLRRPADVRQHILRCHTLGPMYCANCWRSWDQSQSGEFVEHTVAMSCDRVPQPEHLNRVEQSDLEAMDLGGPNGREKWYLIWDTLFSDHERPDSPYQDPTAKEILTIVRFLGVPATVIQPLTWSLNQPRAPRYRRQQDAQRAIQQAIQRQAETRPATGSAAPAQIPPIYPPPDMGLNSEFILNDAHLDETRAASANDIFQDGWYSTFDQLPEFHPPPG